MLQESLPLPRQTPLNLLANDMENVGALILERSMLLKYEGGGPPGPNISLHDC